MNESIFNIVNRRPITGWTYTWYPGCVWPCSDCKLNMNVSKKRHCQAQRGIPIYCSRCESKRNQPPYECSNCHKFTRNFEKGPRKRARKGEPAVCNDCTQAEKEERMALRRKKYEEELQKRATFRLQNPMPPAHPDEGKYHDWTPDQTLTIHSGGICFGLSYEVKQAAAKSLCSFEEMAHLRNKNNSTVAKNGNWVAFKLTGKNEHYKMNFTTGWFACHHTLDPVAEVRKLIYHGIEYHCGGGLLDNRNRSHHKDLNMVLIPRYIMGTTYEFEDKEAKKILKEGLYLVDYQDAKESTKPSSSKNAIKGMYSSGDYDMGCLSYDKNGLCQSFLLAGTSSDFTCTYFPEGTAPLVQSKWPDLDLDDTVG